MLFAQKLYLNEKIRFLIWGLVNTATGYLFFGILYWSIGTQIGYFGAVIWSYFIGSIVSFVNTKFFVFRAKGQVITEYLRFVVVYVPIVVLNLITLPFLLRETRMNPYIGQAVVMAFLAILSFLAHKYFSFFRKK